MADSFQDRKSVFWNNRNNVLSLKNSISETILYVSREVIFKYQLVLSYIAVSKLHTQGLLLFSLEKTRLGRSHCSLSVYKEVS